jgi:hypothetical protein
METTVVRYKVKADCADENKDYIRKVFAQLDEDKPDGLRYVSFNLDDGLSFVHIAVVETADGKNPLADKPAFQDFVSGIKGRCEESPVATKADIVGSYRLFWQRELEP